ADQEQMDAIFDCIDTGDVGFICREDVVFLEVDPQVRQRESYKLKGGKVREWKEFAALQYLQNARNVNSTGKPSEALHPKHRLAPRPWQAGTFETIPLVLISRRRDREREARLRAKSARIVFKHHLCACFGNEVRAVRRSVGGMDEQDISVLDLRRYCRKVDMPVNFTDLFSGLDFDGDGICTLEELCPERAEDLAKFKDWAQKTLGCCANLWSCEEAVLARAKQRGSKGGWISETKMQMKPFMEALSQLGWPGVTRSEERMNVFSSLDAFGCGLIQPTDLAWLDRWSVPEWLASEPDHDAWAKLKELFVTTYGHPLRAWRVALDRLGMQLCETYLEE
ncbi:unnamed protein product, partial [Polarella glacialis]